MYIYLCLFKLVRFLFAPLIFPFQPAHLLSSPRLSPTILSQADLDMLRETCSLRQRECTELHNTVQGIVEEKRATELEQFSMVRLKGRGFQTPKDWHRERMGEADTRQISQSRKAYIYRHTHIHTHTQLFLRFTFSLQFSFTLVIPLL